jgi:outer membrane protein OmpA-like peptidoglycan-associated protein
MAKHMKIFRHCIIGIFIFSMIIGLIGYCAAKAYTKNANCRATTRSRQLSMLSQYGVHYIYLHEKLVILVPTLVLFEPNSSTLKPGAHLVLNPLTNYLTQYPNANILVAGNASPIVDRKLFEKGRISMRRARKVARYFKQQGINPGCANRKLLYTSYGANYPIATNEKNSGLTVNRRIQIVVYPKNTLPYVGKKPPEAIFHHW